MTQQFIITMAGFGTRFREAGYTCPKYQIVVKGRTLFSWAMLSLHSWFDCGDFFFVVRRADEADTFIRNECAELGITCAGLILLDQPTNGQATSALLALDGCGPELPVAIYNIDTHITPGAFEMPPAVRNYGFVPAFRAEGSHWSFVALRPDSSVERITEKERISEFATVGLYWFRSAMVYRECYAATYPEASVPAALREAYVAPVYQHLLEKRLSVSSTILPRDCVHALGTPAEVDAFAKSGYCLRTNRGVSHEWH